MLTVMRKRMPWACLAVISLGLSACSPPSTGPHIESPAGEPRYAVGFPADLEAKVAEVQAIEDAVDVAVAHFASYPDAYEDPPWERVREAITLADRAGRSRTYVERHDEVDAVATFLEDDDKKLQQKLAGTASYTAKQQGAREPAVVGGAVSHVFSKTVEQRLQEEGRAGNVAHDYVDRYEPVIGKKNVESLREQIDEISATSFAVYIDLVRISADLDRDLEESSQIEKTLEATVEEYEAIASDGERTTQEREAAKNAAKLAREAQGKLEASVEEARKTSDELADRSEDAQKLYEEHFQKLQKALEER